MEPRVGTLFVDCYNSGNTEELCVVINETATRFEFFNFFIGRYDSLSKDTFIRDLDNRSIKILIP
jgi:hypothetical protein